MRTALVIVDMLNDFVDGVLGNPPSKEIVEPIASLGERARASDDWVVVYANDAHHLSDVELRVFPPHAMAGTPGAAVISELRPGPEDIVINKRFYSAFTDTELQSTLRVHDVGRLVLVGQHTDCCVRHTSYDAFVRDYELVVCPRTRRRCSSPVPMNRMPPAKSERLSTCTPTTERTANRPPRSGRSLIMSDLTKPHETSTGPMAADHDVVVGHRLVPHTADCIIEAWGSDRPFVSDGGPLCVGGGSRRSARPRRFSSYAPRHRVRGADDALVSLFEDVIYAVDVFSVVPVRFHLTETESGGIAGDMEVVPVEQAVLVGPVPKAVSYHGLSMIQGEGGWRCRVLIDV